VENTNSASTTTTTLTAPIDPATNGKILLWHTPSNFAWVGEVKLVGVSSAGLGIASFIWDVELLNVAGTLTVTKLVAHSSTSGNLSTVTADLIADPANLNRLNVHITRTLPVDAVQSTWHATYFTTYTNLP